jgi:hypothetical protein
MITKDTVLAWRKLNNAALAEIGETDPTTTKPYTVMKTISDTDVDLLALRALDRAAVAAGFSAIRLEKGRWCTSYSAIYVRIFVEHTEAQDKSPQIDFTAVSAGMGVGADNIEVAHWRVNFEAHQPIIGQIHFDIAKLVLPQ